jgi:Arc/MetJ-type ribon-helix-helix transcriptional regulator
MKASPAKPIMTVQMSTELLTAIDTIAAREFRSRSDVVRQAVLRDLEARGIVPVRQPVAA